MKKLLKRVWAFIAGVFNRLEDETKKLVPVAINVVQGLKAVMDSPVDDILLSIVKAAIPGDADDLLIDRIKSVVEKYIPLVLTDLKMVGSIAGIEDQNKQLQAILDQFKLSSDETKNIFYHGLSCLILEKLSDGKLSWSDSIAIGEYYYQNISKK
ncbi:MAG: hypothetical protein JZU49_01195 [Sulfuricurvum sp.]|jgi:hypothetical protein|nr:hypothetical protein [Sulfuricurvum sp.]